jgi:cell division protein FtsI/penicillin-binding protein 2
MLGLFLVTWMMVIIWRLAWVQVVDHDRYVDQADRNHRRTIVLSPARGSIVDREGKLLAMSVVNNSVLIDQVLFNDIAGRNLSPAEKERRAAEKRSRVAGALGPLLGMAPSELESRLVGRNQHLWLKRHLDSDVAEKVRELIAGKGLTGIRLVEEVERSYPHQQLAAHLLGYMGADGQSEERRGRGGIELRFDDWLKGKRGEVSLLSTGKGQAYERQDLPPAVGATVHLTIDAALQRKAEHLLEQAVRQHRAKGGGVVVMDPATGEILALANAPTFDPNRIDGNVTASPSYVNQAVTSPYEPGSIFKIITYAAGFEEGVIKPEELIDCGNGQMAIGSRIIRDTHPYGRITVEEAFAKSSNVGAIRIAQRLGKQTFHSYIKRFGFGEPTRIDLPGESRGIVHAPEKWRADSIGSVAMGQEISVTLIQAVTAIATIANKGVRVQPHLVRRVVNPDGTTVFYQPEIRRDQVISERTAQLMTRVLERVVTDGTGRHAVQLEGYRAAGKTGTPQKPGPSGYGAGKYMPSFLGFVPATNPRYAMVVMIDEPAAGAYYGGVVAAPVFSMLAAAALGDHDVMPDETEYRARMDQLVKRFSSGGHHPEVADGDEIGGGAAGSAGQVNAVVPGTPTPFSGGGGAKVGAGEAKPVAPGRSVAARSTPGATGTSKGVIELGDGSFRVMPDLRGRGSRAVTQACIDLQLKLRLSGAGVAVSQSPPAGTRVRAGDECRVTFQ